jgi:uncharacterized protein YejL (UPF0352 family)
MRRIQTKLRFICPYNTANYRSISSKYTDFNISRSINDATKVINDATKDIQDTVIDTAVLNVVNTFKKTNQRCKEANLSFSTDVTVTTNIGGVLTITLTKNKD